MDEKRKVAASFADVGLGAAVSAVAAGTEVDVGALVGEGVKVGATVGTGVALEHAARKMRMMGNIFFISLFGRGRSQTCPYASEKFFTA